MQTVCLTLGLVHANQRLCGPQRNSDHQFYHPKDDCSVHDLAVMTSPPLPFHFSHHLPTPWKTSVSSNKSLIRPLPSWHNLQLLFTLSFKSALLPGPVHSPQQMQNSSPNFYAFQNQETTVWSRRWGRRAERALEPSAANLVTHGEGLPGHQPSHPHCLFCL